jgi:hypothetical protein
MFVTKTTKHPRHGYHYMYPRYCIAPVGGIPSAFGTAVHNFCGVWRVDYNEGLVMNRKPTSFMVLHVPQA